MSKLNDVIKTAIDNLQQIVDANTIIGTPINTDSGTTVIPVSKVSIGIASGGIDYVTNKNTSLQNFGGGNGAGVTVSPVAFIVVNADGDTKILNMNATASSQDSAIATIDNIITKAPEVIEKIKNIFTSDKNDTEEIEELSK